MDQVLLARMHKVVEANLKNEQFSVEDLAEEVALSRSHLHRKLRQLTGRSISQYIRRIRLDHATTLLQKEVGTVSEIAFRVGFGSSTYFIKCFSEEFGFSPGEVKKKLEEGYYGTSDDVDPVQSEQPATAIAPKPSPLEQLHPASSESMIREIFDAMIAHKPVLEKFILVDEDEGETVDIRLLAYQIFKNYPWPIGVEIRRLFSVGLKNSTKQRYAQLQKTALRNVRLMAFIAISELVQMVQTKKVKLTNEEKDVLRTNLQTISASGLVAIINTVVDVASTHKNTCFVEELNEIFDVVFFREMDDWLALTQDESIASPNYEELCAGLEQIVVFLLKKSAFLVKYKLVNVGSIKVLKSKFKPATFEHNLHILNSADADFQLHQEVLDQFSDSNAVLLLKSIKDSKKFLNLSPLVIDTHSEEIHSKESARLKKDIFLFDKYKDGNLHYLGTEVTANNDLSGLKHYNELVEEYEVMMKLISQ